MLLDERFSLSEDEWNNIVAVYGEEAFDMNVYMRFDKKYRDEFSAE